MEPFQCALAYFNNAREELVARIGLRDQVLLVFLGATGTIFGVALGMTNNSILLSLPFLALGASVIVSQHNSVIGSLADYCVHELEPYLNSLLPPPHVPQWDNSKALRKYSSEAIKHRTWGHAIIIVVPSVVSLVANASVGFSGELAHLLIWWFGVISIVIGVINIVKAHKWRKDLYKEYRAWKKPVSPA